MADSKFGPSGGVGGSSFDAPKPSGDLTWRIREFNMRSASRIDQIQVEWANSAGDIKDSHKFGGEGGTDGEFDIANNDYLTKIDGTVGDIQRSTRLFSLQFTTKNGSTSDIFGTRGVREFCPFW
ncbi:hypothetical protein KAR48_05835 [bacterium]|nr:hypothetical protein [bacterium]